MYTQNYEKKAECGADNEKPGLLSPALFENEKKEKKRKRSYYRQRHMRSVPAARR
jgi:hypothetical protein